MKSRGHAEEDTGGVRREGLEKGGSDKGWHRFVFRKRMIKNEWSGKGRVEYWEGKEHINGRKKPNQEEGVGVLEIGGTRKGGVSL